MLLKKITAGLLAFLLLFAIVGCDESTAKESTKEGEQVENNANASPSKPSAGSENTQVDPHRVTKEEWEQALQFLVPVTTAAQHVWYPPSDFHPQGRFIYYDVITYGESVLRIYDTDETQTQITGERYYVKNGDSYTRYDKWSEGEWHSEASSKEAYQRNFERYTLTSEIFFYDDFVYNEAKKVYECAQLEGSVEGQSYVYYHVELKFSDGKLESYYMEGEGDGYNCIRTTLGYEPINIVLPFEP